LGRRQAAEDGAASQPVIDETEPEDKRAAEPEQPIPDL
jgi:hypothetical protein